jgi:uncharacterized DUF497 family protein
MDIGFVWDEVKYNAVVMQHNISIYEVVAALDDTAGYEVPGPAEHEDRWLWVGRTPWDRLLIVVYTEEDLPLYRIVTAFEAQGRWVDEYHRR